MRIFALVIRRELCRFAVIKAFVKGPPIEFRQNIKSKDADTNAFSALPLCIVI